MEYVITNREGKSYSVQTDKELTQEDLSAIEVEITPARASDYFLGIAESASTFALQIPEALHEVGNFLGNKIGDVLYPDQGDAVIPNYWTEFKNDNKDFYTGDVPNFIKDKLSYKVTQGLTQLVPQLLTSSVSKPLGTVTIMAQGASSGMDDYFNELGIDRSEASPEQIAEARKIGAMNAVSTGILESIGINKILRGLKADLKPGVAPATKRVVGIMATEGATEGLETGASNIIAKDIAKYAEDRARTEGMAEAALVGTIVGGVPGGVRYAPNLAVEGAGGTIKVAQKVTSAGQKLAETQAAKSIVSGVGSGLIYSGDVATDLSQKAINGLMARGVDVTPILRGGTLVADKSFDALTKTGSKVKELAEGPIRTVDNFIRPLVDSVSAVNKRMGNELKRFEFESLKRIAEFNKIAEAPLQILDRIEKENKRDADLFHKAILQKDFETARQIFLRYGDQNSWNQIGGLLNTIYQQSVQRDPTIGFVEKYFPRFVLDYPKLAEKLGYKLPKTEWERALANPKNKNREPEEIFEDILRNKKRTGVRKPKPTFVKERNLDVISDEFLEFYARPADALRFYINQMSDSITRMDYLGAMYDIIEAEDPAYEEEIIDPEEPSKPEVVPKVGDKTRRLGAFGRVMREEIDAGRLDDDKIDQLHKLLGARFNKKAPMGRFFRGAKTLTHLLFLGSPTSAITQLGDYAYSLHQNSINETLRAVGKSSWTLNDVYLITNAISWDFNEKDSINKKGIPEGLQKTLDKTFDITGFRAMDAKAKATFLTATANRFRKTLNGPDSQKKFDLIQKIQETQGFMQATRTIADLKAGKKSDNVAEILFYELGEIAPLTQSDLPYLYNMHPNARVLYALKSYTIKQFNYARRRGFAKIFSGNKGQVKDGFRDLLSLTAALALANVPADIIKDVMLNRDIDSFDNVVLDNLWRLLGMNSYQQVQLERDGPGTLLQELTVNPPLVDIMDALYKDITQANIPLTADSKSTKYLPVFGRLYDGWALK